MNVPCGDESDAEYAAAAITQAELPLPDADDALVRVSKQAWPSAEGPTRKVGVNLQAAIQS